jgi:hypothetical protein
MIQSWPKNFSSTSILTLPIPRVSDWDCARCSASARLQWPHPTFQSCNCVTQHFSHVIMCIFICKWNMISIVFRTYMHCMQLIERYIVVFFIILVKLNQLNLVILWLPNSCCCMLTRVAIFLGHPCKDGQWGYREHCRVGWRKMIADFSGGA